MGPLYMKKWLTLFVVILVLIFHKFLLPGNCPLSIPYVNSKLCRIMSSNQRKGNVKLVTLKKSLDKVVEGVLNIFTEV